MKTRNKLLTMLILSSGAASATALINKAIQISATSAHLLRDSKSLCFKWRLGNVHYTKQGNGKPLLLLHDLCPASSGREWDSLGKLLAQNFTVYTIDLLGFGLSEKPNLTYTNYLYVQLLSDFIKSEIGHRTDIVASGASSSLAVMACSSSPELFDRLMLINPESILSSGLVPGKNAKLYKLILDLPIVGTLIYQISCSKKSIRRDFVEHYFYNPYAVRPQMLNLFHESAHLGESPKSVYASVKCSYTKCNITGALKKIDNSIYLIGSTGEDGMKERLEEYKSYNPAIEYALLPHTKHLPQMEKPDEVYSLIQTYFS